MKNFLVKNKKTIIAIIIILAGILGYKVTVQESTTSPSSEVYVDSVAVDTSK